MFQEKQLGQSRINGTTATSVYSPAVGVTAIIKTIYIANQSGSADTYRLFVDDDGTTYDQTTALFYDIVIEADETLQIDTFIAMNDPSGNVAFQNGTANALTITLFGAEIT
jgi:hypothetical protein